MAGKQGRDFQPAPGNFQNNVKLSELSLEERMAYYKQKYDKSITVGGSKKVALTAEPVRRGSPPEQVKPEHKKPKGTSRRKQKKHKSAKPQQGAENTVISQPAAVEQKAPKKGILARLFGALKK
jgi:hypothetical protein